MSDRFGWDPPEEDEQEEQDGQDEPGAGSESPGGWPDQEREFGRHAPSRWPDDEPEPLEEEDPDDWAPSSEPAWQESGSGSYRDYGDYRYAPGDDLFAEEHASDRYSTAPRSRDPLARLFPGLPRSVRVTLDWILTIAGAILIVLALKQWVINPYRIPSSSMEPTLNCAKPALGCLGDSSDRVLACRICLDFRSPHRNDIVVFNTPSEAALKCGEGGTFVKRVIGLPGETVHEDRTGFIFIRGPDSKKWVKLKEPFISAKDRLADSQHFGITKHVPPGQYFMMGDNRSQSCDSRTWGAVPRDKLIGIVFFVYWPPDRISFR
jgi:signal peptidase I